MRYVVNYGAHEVDVVIDRSLALNHRWEELYEELKAIRLACDGTSLKVILSTGELFNLTDVYKASMVAMMAGADFIKTSTGKEAVNATLPVGIVMCRAIKEFKRITGRKVCAIYCYHFNCRSYNASLYTIRRLVLNLLEVSRLHRMHWNGWF